MLNRFVLRHRRQLLAGLRYAATLLLLAALLVACTVWPMLRGWWDTAIPAAIGSAIAALLVFAVAVNAPLEFIPYVALYFDREPTLERRPRGFGRALYREAALSEFESPDPLDTHQAPLWHAPEAALPVVERLLAERPSDPHLAWLHGALRAAAQSGAKFYFLVLSLSGGTNARVEALRHGDLSVISARPASSGDPPAA